MSAPWFITNKDYLTHHIPLSQKDHTSVRRNEWRHLLLENYYIHMYILQHFEHVEILKLRVFICKLLIPLYEHKYIPHIPYVWAHRRKKPLFNNKHNTLLVFLILTLFSLSYNMFV